MNVIDLTTRYLGLRLRSPLVASASPMTGHLNSLRRLEEAGAGAVVLPSLFEEQIVRDAEGAAGSMETGAECFSESLTYEPDLEDYNSGPSGYLDLLERAKDALQIPVIASLNGVSDGWWVRFSKAIEEAGADAIELNVYVVAADRRMSGDDVERRYLELIGAVRESVRIPLAVKIGPYFSSLPHLADRMVEAGADGLVLFNRFYQPDLELEDFRVVRHLALSTSAELRLPLRWIGMLHGRIAASLGATTGIHTVEDVLRVLLAGADVAMMASALIRRGPVHIERLEGELVAWLEAHGYGSVSEIRGRMSHRSVADPSGYERANYMRTLSRYTAKVRG
jgi:dihydroorotate dehydrogenase (fumarate)